MKRPTKRKMYQKRRKKEKAEQRKKASQTKLPGSTTAPSTYKFISNNNNTSKQYPRNLNSNPTGNNRYHRQPNTAISPITSYSQGLQLWWQTYCSAIEFHTKQQNAWKGDKNEYQLTLLEKYANEYETSSGEEEDGDNDEYYGTILHPNRCETILDHEHVNDGAAEEDVDEEYIKFLQITHKHREELRLKRAAENI